MNDKTYSDPDNNKILFFDEIGLHLSGKIDLALTLDQLQNIVLLIVLIYWFFYFSHVATGKYNDHLSRFANWSQ